jgi:hypothetical protein
MWYRSSSRQVRRLGSILPGPVAALYGETVAGAAVVRAFGMQSVFVQSKPLAQSLVVPSIDKIRLGQDHKHATILLCDVPLTRAMGHP